MFDSAFYSRLGRLKLAVDKKSNASLLGSRKSTRKGSSAEFSDFREYIPGDDIRSIDWNAYARLDRLYIKEYMEEKESSISFFLDLSPSMDYGEPTKTELAEELTAGLAYIALMNLDHVTVYDLADTARRHVAGGGARGYRELTAWLEKLGGNGGCADLTKGVRSIQRMQPGLSIVVSDFLSEEFVEDTEALEKAIRYLQYRRQKVVLLQVMAGEELNIDLTGTYFLIDAEDESSRVHVTMDSESVGKYDRELKGFLNRIQQCAKKCGASWHLCSTADGFERIIFNELRDIYEY
ncbi:MAG: DUF58 domain-containing protein [Lachnospiraceae bacterium]|nr:DUF58 domain-containing protein [Lachnospiraceae bacterium]